MLNMSFFKITGSKIIVNDRKIVWRRYIDREKTMFEERTHYMTEEELADYKENYITKHSLQEIAEEEVLDTEKYKWMAGLEIKGEDKFAELEKIAACGSYDGYIASLDENRDLYLLDLESRVSVMELLG